MNRLFSALRKLPSGNSESLPDMKETSNLSVGGERDSDSFIKSKIIKPIVLRIPITGIIVFLLIMVSCTNSQQAEEQNLSNEEEAYFEEEDETEKDYFHIGDSVTRLSQEALLKKVSSAMQEGGVNNALKYCNLNALGITDSLSRAFDCRIRRVSNKPRNPADTVSNTFEKEAMLQYTALSKKGFALEPILREGDEAFYYFKPIKTGVPACLKCHGTPGQELAETDFKIIKALYPEDKATGYGLNEFRGFWSLRFLK